MRTLAPTNNPFFDRFWKPPGLGGKSDLQIKIKS